MEQSQQFAMILTFYLIYIERGWEITMHDLALYLFLYQKPPLHKKVIKKSEYTLLFDIGVYLVEK